MAGGEIPDAIPDVGGGATLPPPGSAAPRRRPSPRAAPNAYASGWDLGSGPASRSVIDRQRASTIEELAAALTPSVTIRIFRLQPTWCAGWLEDHMMEQATIGELLEHLRSEHGGKVYRVQALTPNGSPMYETMVPIAGPPRHEGRVIDRSRWEAVSRGEPIQDTRAAPPAAAAAAPAPAPAAGGIDPLAFMKLVLDQNEKTQATTLEAVREMTRETRRQTESILSSIMKPPQGSIGETLGEIGKVAQGLKATGKVLASTFGGDGGGNAGPPDPDAMRSQALQNFMMNAIMGGGQQQPRYPRPRRVRVVQQAPAPAQSTTRPAAGGNGKSDDIPNAI